MQSRCNRRYGAFLLVFVLGASGSALAQNPTFALEGTVVDAQQAVLPGATVTVQNTSTGLMRTVTTDEGGRFVVRALPPEGRYTVKVEIAGFATEVREGLRFNAGQSVVLNFSLKLSTVQETITVAGDAPTVQTTSSEVSSTIDRTAFENLPVKERNYFRLLTLDSNVVAAGTGSNAVNVGGQEVWNFGTYVDGTNNHSKWLTLQRAPQLGSSGFAIETVKEVQLITNQFSAEFGGHSAGVASMITKSGTNDLNGSAFVMIRPGDLDATPPLTPVKAPYNQQQFGGTVGGPFIRDKAFYFGSYERRRERSQVVVTSPEAFGLVVPTPADEHQGHFKGDVRFSAKNSLGVRYNMVRWKKDNESGGFNASGHRLPLGQQRRHGARHVPVGDLGPVPERSARPVLALHRSARREVRLRVDSARRLRDHRRLRLRHVGRAARGDLRHLGHGLAVDGQSLDEDRRVVHL